VPGGISRLKLKLLDLFCGAGGATAGYQQAGFYVVGVDIKPQPNYCGDEFYQTDAMTFPLDGFDVVHASPPCHDHSNVTGRNRKAKGTACTAWMLSAMIERLRGKVFVVENVETADMPYSLLLCGSMFGLDVRRHRLFATSHLIPALPCQHHLQEPRFRSLDSRSKGLSTVVGVHGHLNYPGELELRRKSMSIDWMTNAEICQAIPPPYTKYVGERLIEYLSR
jgi:DNA (cytosine-5)-methyltransferase 1